MPTSYYGQISTVLQVVQEINPASILDIGVGFGKYGVLCRELFDIPYERYSKDTWKTRIDGIEGYAQYINPIHSYVYDNVYYSRAEDIIEKLDFVYDLAMMIDILEHFEKQEGGKLLLKILKKCKNLIVSVPAIPCFQTYLDNDLEEHKSIWTVNDFGSYNLLKAGTVPMTVNNENIIVLLKGC
jgi:hypothetical protein